MLKRELDEHEIMFKTMPRDMALMHYKDMCEPFNPYTLGSVESLEYTDAFQKCMRLFEDAL
jgi:hypothetical protein